MQGYVNYLHGVLLELITEIKATATETTPDWGFCNRNKRKITNIINEREAEILQWFNRELKSELKGDWGEWIRVFTQIQANSKSATTKLQTIQDSILEILLVLQAKGWSPPRRCTFSKSDTGYIVGNTQKVYSKLFDSALGSGWMNAYDFENPSPSAPPQELLPVLEPFNEQKRAYDFEIPPSAPLQERFPVLEPEQIHFRN